MMHITDQNTATIILFYRIVAIQMLLKIHYTDIEGQHYSKSLRETNGKIYI